MSAASGRCASRVVETTKRSDATARCTPTEPARPFHMRWGSMPSSCQGSDTVASHESTT
jgi:hypothetical protein